MGLIWDLIQHGQLRTAQHQTDALDERVARLEDELARTNETLVRLLRLLERRFGEDLDGNGRVGG